jgi:hypothetical protein
MTYLRPALVTCALLLSACNTITRVPTSNTPTSSLPVLTDTETNTDGLFFGIFRETAAHRTVPETVASELRRTPASVMWFEQWGDEVPFPTQDVQALQGQGVLPHITWEPWKASLSLDDPGQIRLGTIVSGQYDAYITRWAKAAAATQKPLLLRFGHEFNGNWYPWATGQNANDPQKYVQAYRHVHDLFRAAGATNVQWIWTYNNDDVPGDAWNAPSAAYPGDAYVDWVGIDGYNWGTNPSWGNWRSVTDLFGAAYAKAQQIAPSKPIMLAEFASADVGGNKPAWIDDLFQTLPKSFPKVRAFTWFDIQKEEDWRINSTLASQERFIVGLRGKNIRSSGAAMAQVPAQTKGGQTGGGQTGTGPTPLPSTARPLATFETLTDGRPTSQNGGQIYLSGYQQDAAHPSSFSNQAAGSEAAPLVVPASGGRSQYAAFDYAITAPNQYAGVVMTVELNPRSGTDTVGSDQSAYGTLHLDLAGTGATQVRLELIGERSLGIADGSNPQVYVTLPAGSTSLDVPISRFAQPDWAPTKVATGEVMKRLVAVQLVVDQVPASGRVELDNLALLP